MRCAVRSGSKAAAPFILILCLPMISAPAAEASVIKIGQAEKATLFSTVTPLNATPGTLLTWLVWTDPIVTDETVTFEVADATNGTTLHRSTATLTSKGTVDPPRTVDTAGYSSEHSYQFTATLKTGEFAIQTTKLLTFRFKVIIYADSHSYVQGETAALTISEVSPYPYIPASTNLTIQDESDGTMIQATLPLPEEKGESSLNIDTATFPFGTYTAKADTTSDMGVSYADTMFEVRRLMIDAEGGLLFVGDMARVTVRAVAALHSATMTIYRMRQAQPPYPEVVVKRQIALTAGTGTATEPTSLWTPATYTIVVNATLDGHVAEDVAYVTVKPFSLQASCGKVSYIQPADSSISVSIATAPAQRNSLFNLTITNSTHHTAYKVESQTLSASGAASIQIPSDSLTGMGDYTVEAAVRWDGRVELGFCSFSLYASSFDLYSHTASQDVEGYKMPELQLTLTPQQQSVSTSINVVGQLPRTFAFAGQYTVNITTTVLSTYTYRIPLASMLQGTYTVNVNAKSLAGENSTLSIINYTNGRDTDGDGLSDSSEEGLSTDPLNYDTDADGYYDGLEFYNSAQPTDSGSTPLPQATITPAPTPTATSTTQPPQTTMPPTPTLGPTTTPTPIATSPTPYPGVSYLSNPWVWASTVAVVAGVAGYYVWWRWFRKPTPEPKAGTKPTP